MSKKHFIRLAQYIRTEVGYKDAFNDNQIDLLARFCAEFNPNFNRERWLDYIAGKCGPNGGKR